MKIVNIMKIILWVGVLVSLCSNVYAQSMYGDQVKADVKMKYLYSFEEALREAQKTDRPIFVNCFADWAIPCHAMNQVVFSDQEFADWMEKHFVNLFIDITTREGNPWARKYNALKMAQYVVLNARGEVIYRIVGGKKLPEFQNLLAQALNPKTTLPGMRRAYDKGERGLKFLRSYSDVLNLADERNEARKIIDELFSRLKDKEIPKKENWNYFIQKARDSKSELFQSLLNRKFEFVKNLGKEEVDRFISEVYASELFSLACGTMSYNADRMIDLALELHRSDLPDTNNVFVLYDIAKCRGEKRYQRIVELLRKCNLPREWHMNLDFTLGELKGLANSQRDTLIVYLKERSAGLASTPLKYYYQAIANLENKEGIQFQNLTFEAALKLAAKEGKKVFMDCYTEWCGPCKIMNEQVFTTKEVGDYFREHFVSLKIDMEKGEGITLGKKFDVRAYPTMFIFDVNGMVINRLQGARDAKTFLKEVKNSLGELK